MKGKKKRRTETGGKDRNDGWSSKGEKLIDCINLGSLFISSNLRITSAELAKKNDYLLLLLLFFFILISKENNKNKYVTG